MKRSLALILMLASGFALNAAAQTSAAPAAAPPGPAKIAVILFQMAVFQTNEGQRDVADFERKFAPKEAQLNSLNDEIESLTKQFQQQGNMLSDSEREARLNAIDEKKTQLTRADEDLKKDKTREGQKMQKELQAKVGDVMVAYAQQQGYTMILDLGQENSPVLWEDNSTNITKAVIEAYNVKSGVPAPQAQAPAPQAKPAAAKPPAAH